MEINTIDDCLKALGSKNSFVETLNEPISKLTPSGNVAFETLRNILIFMVYNDVVNCFNEDKLDEIVNQKGY